MHNARFMVTEMIYPSELTNRYLGPNIALFKICTLKLQEASFPELLVGLSTGIHCVTSVAFVLTLLRRPWKNCR